MENIDKKDLWELYFESEVKSRYFLRLSSYYKNLIFWISFFIAVFSCGPLVNVFWKLHISWLAATVGVIAALLGMYLSISSLPKKLAVSIYAAKVWNKTCRDYSEFWSRYKAGEKINPDLIWELDRSLNMVDEEVTEYLNTNSKLLDKAEDEARNFLLK